ncbi:MAG: acyl-CoA synthetase [Oceanospirillaceae bacterium]|uniref:acyl-CoA synthetase n=1 Tax=unclassified Thalassolituus TaxID=2624967 RepID=UPI000C0B1B84|nr:MULTISPECIES: acyl-CoA synthetase [unclassified Thalassolituus]MAK90811.1 acyl-CoA synthetase [Thalassolituus sp.]MAS24670.1 acyl-CoA synthetase [Oceanospirillaceae bacterium]MAX98420.1 acyl-CoA synthetase [Oceanospirillaceae bacterium]MBL35593.1 acyl-CoA synthetase [Oceanospirillaceae bacterium]MBS51190.1 acyl-CoA synthetase [Oceanospirillaceae bacterium]|tara:strand:+ start:675 stop:2300 length:1626 start_codon:yes stop_codon:yes gene_type:complete
MQHYNIYDMGLDANPANYATLSPVSYLQRAAFVYPGRVAQVHQDTRYTWAETYERCVRLASALDKMGIQKGETVSFLCSNIPPMFEAHFGVPMTGAVLNAINTRLDAEAIAFILQHAETKILFVDREFGPVAKKALAMLPNKPTLIGIDDPYFTEGDLLGQQTYEDLLADASADYDWQLPENEWDAITLNYTSGTTGNPKGVVYHHRGAYLNAANNIVSWDMGKHPVYLWILPLFHCNGWCFPWTIAASAGVSVSLRHVRADAIFDAIKTQKVSHFCGAPIVLNMLNNAPADMKAGIEHEVNAMVAGAAPPAAVIEGMERMGFHVTHVYGLTETYGPCILCEWKDEWSDKNPSEKAALKARQGVKSAMQEDLMVASPDDMQPVPRDGETIGEIFIRGNIVMKGYLKNPRASEEAFSGDWFHTGDLAVWHEDGYIEIKDRSKDIIISGGENISSIEVEDILYRHPDVEEAAVVARPDDKWGETPCAFIKLKEGANTLEEEIIEFCRNNMAHFKIPRHIVFGELPKTSTGKIQKFVLRQQAKE